MTKLILLCACLLALAAPARAAAEPPKIVVVRIYQGNRTIAIITRGEGKSERIEITTGLSDKRLIEASEGYYKLFERLYQEGFTLQNSFNTVSSNDNFTTFLFTKAQ